VPINRLAVLGYNTISDQRELTSLLTRVLDLWKKQAELNSHLLDDKLADYVFIPLSQILRRQRDSPSIVLEATLRVLTELIRYGWRSKASEELASQLLLLFTYIIDGAPGELKGKGEGKQKVSEELILEGYRALGALIRTAGQPRNSFLEAAENVPAAGHAVAVILDGVKDGATPEIQMAALEALDALQTVAHEQSMLATFLPGTVSALSTSLAPPVSLKRQRRVLVRGLEVLRLTLTRTLSDIKVLNLLPKETKLLDLARNTETPAQSYDGSMAFDDKGKVLTTAWLKATASQVKVALASVLRLRNHDAEDVQQALSKLCIALIDECRQSLRDSESILVETAMLLAPNEAKSSLTDTSLVDLVMIHPDLSSTVKTIMFNWVSSLPTAMQAADERIKQQALRCIGRGGRIISDLQLQSSTLDDALAISLKDSIMVLMLNSESSVVQNDVETEQNGLQSGTLQLSGRTGTFSPIFLQQSGGSPVREEVEVLITNIGSSDRKLKLASQMLGFARDLEGPDQISSFWLAYRLTQSAMTLSEDEDILLDFSNDHSATQQESAVFQELHDFSISVVAAHSDTVDADWRLEAIALEAAAFVATRMKQDFRPELIDVLYPIATFLGSPEPQLRHHAITALNVIAASCGYDSVSDLIIANGDYMVNSVALRLNTLDVSPASMQVLTMMIQLTGSRLIPFLDDVVATIFAMLDNYHGYTAFAEGLFGVLKEVVEQGVKEERLMLEAGQEQQGRTEEYRKKMPQGVSAEDIVDLMERRQQAKLEREEGQREEASVANPKRAFREELAAIEERDGNHQSGEDEEEDEDQDNKAREEEPHQAVEKPKPAPSPTYILLNKIAKTTQHYLTSPTATLRKSLLELLGTVSPALAQDEDTFLPLINDVWPVVIARLQDEEPFVIIAACRAIAALCVNAGDFLASRIKTEWADGLGRWCARIKNEADQSPASRDASSIRGGVRKADIPLILGQRKQRSRAGADEGDGDILMPQQQSKSDMTDQLVSISTSTKAATIASTSRFSPSTALSSRGLGRFAQAAQTWSAVQRLLVAIVMYVRIDDEVFDQILDLVIDALEDNEEMRTALEVINADAVWLARYERGHVEETEAPSLEGVAFLPLQRA
jgi:TELO2-interacting protein 1